MSEAQIFKLGDITRIEAGHPFRGKVPEQPHSGTVAVQMKDVDPKTGVRWESCVHTGIEGRRQPTWLHKGHILFAARGTRYYSIAVEGVPAQWQAVAAPQFFVIEPFYGDLLPSFLAWQMNQAPCQQYFEQQAEGSVTKSIRRSVLEGAPIAIPPLAKQQAIVALAIALRQEQHIIEQLLRNNERLLSSIASDLLHDTSAQRSG